MTLIERPASIKSGGVIPVFYGPRELRAGWRLLLFVGILAALIPLGNLVARAIVGDADDVTLELAKKIVNIAVWGSWKGELFPITACLGVGRFGHISGKAL